MKAWPCHHPTGSSRFSSFALRTNESCQTLSSSRLLVLAQSCCSNRLIYIVVKLFSISRVLQTAAQLCFVSRATDRAGRFRSHADPSFLLSDRPNDQRNGRRNVSHSVKYLTIFRKSSSSLIFRKCVHLIVIFYQVIRTSLLPYYNA